MSTKQKIFHLLDVLDIDQKEFAEKIGTTDKVVSKWKVGALKSYTKYLPEISSFFCVSSEYFLERGIFKQWDLIMKYPISVFSKLKDEIPANFKDLTFSDSDLLRAWLDKRMCYGITGQDEIDLIQWFSNAVCDIEIVKTSNMPENYAPASVTVKFRPAYKELMLSQNAGNPSITTITMQDGLDNFLSRHRNLSAPINHDLLGEKKEPGATNGTEPLLTQEEARFIGYLRQMTPDQRKALDEKMEFLISMQESPPAGRE